MTTRRQTLGLLSALAMGSSFAQGQRWPSKPIMLVVPFPPGGQTDAVARSVARQLETTLRQPVVIDNRPGANSLIGTQLVSRSAPDGYTLLFNMTALVSNPILQPNARYDALKEFVPIGRIYEIPAVWSVPPKSAQTLEQFIGLAKKAKDPLSFATTGHASSSHYFGEMFARAAGIRLNHVPYKGESPIIPDLIGGRLDAAVVSSATALQYGKDGRIRNLAVSGSHRWKAIPDVPTFLELGVPGMTTETYAGIFAPAGTPRVVVDQLHAAITTVCKTPELQRQLLDNGLEVAPTLSPDQFEALMRKSRNEWLAIKENSAIRVE
ncbi:Bug family tripartite tricarboxylate transporter substrate binding protein [Cupriavidus metallidurans]|uniref:Extra-cytoplasmic solute receptor protein n=1 Tax=Cupriavidus metallidurans (strain ATCC 43123 / DSM 2839 / NBRC 102507 / CH34) TaxID=266264 RepID=Q1LBW4_CUPMC|nr:tripartite tricarboxylate transporter substrate binding protein [Cupriavidus metallidurans]ABF12362.1 extra-cytoplasmic solute receptor protein [Cupriavidus metallidurans CH34]QGS32406.1 tripartite tricarboxylate transporter substrate binding protein [Cupriavidus metallidurans]